MVGQEILVLFIMVRIRAPQPRINRPCAGFIFGLWPRCDTCNEVAGSTTSRFDKPCAIKSSRLPHRRRAFLCVTPRELSAPQPRINRPCAGFIFGLWPRCDTCNEVAGSTTSRFDKPCAIKSSRLPHRRRAFLCVTPRELSAPQPRINRPCAGFIFGSYGTPINGAGSMELLLRIP